MKVSNYQYIQRRELCACEGFQREILTPTHPLCLQEGGWALGGYWERVKLSLGGIHSGEGLNISSLEWPGYL